ncbi:MAG: hypothetical protein J1E40_01845 [Oscillospiraceae bacterium]|nr:hypothetical protein [Oscillospiraceae bacterium]
MLKTETLRMQIKENSNLSMPKRVIVRSKEELFQKISEAEEDIRSGNTYTADEVFSSLREKYGI